MLNNFLKKRTILTFIFILFITYSTSFSSDKFLKGKILSLEHISIPDNQDEDNVVKENHEFRVKILEGKHKNKIISIQHPIFFEESNNIPFEKNDNVVLLEDEAKTLYIVDYDKTGWFIGLSAIFILLTFLIAKGRGIKAILALIITGVFITKLLVPLVIKGYPPIFLSTVVAFLSCSITIILMSGFTSKGFSAILGSFIGVLTAGILSYSFANFMKLSGFSTPEIASMESFLNNINLKELISAGIILGSMGAVMDVAMSISSSLSEIKMRDNNITKKELFKSGINIGSDIIGTMVNTLILAYVGSSFITIILLTIQDTEYPLIRLLNFEFIATEILRSLCGSIGILVAVPATTYFFGIFNSKEKESLKKIENIE